MNRLHLVSALSFLLLACGDSSDPGEDAGTNPGDCPTPSAETTFFVTDEGNGSNGGNFGGLDGADNFCLQAALRAGLGPKDWKAYLSTESVHAKDRIGDGPWKNSKGEDIGDNAAIHSAGIAKALILSECTRPIIYSAADPGGRGAHDIMTGTNAQGELQRQFDGNGLPNGPPATCAEWTSSSGSEIAWIGHSDWNGPDDGWNAAHMTQGCSPSTLAATGANGRIYCFSND